MDGITRYIENHAFQFDNTFTEQEDNEALYGQTIRDLIPSVVHEGLEVNIFAYGQTGSGKTYTMVLF